MRLAPSPFTILPGLPRIGASPLARRSPNIGATLTTLGAKTPAPFVDVAGQPSMKLVSGGRGGIVTVLDRRSKYSDMVSDEDIAAMERLMEKVDAEAIRLSQGKMTYPELRRRNHPYGRGPFTPSGRKRGRIARSGRSGVPSLAVVNKHSGTLAGAWSVDVQRNKAGVRLVLRNEAEYSGWLAWGTRWMQAHGPFTAAMVKYLPEINASWRAAALRAYYREAAAQRLVGDS